MDTESGARIPSPLKHETQRREDSAPGSR